MTLNKIGLILNHPDMFNHFRNILEYLGPEQVDFVIAGENEALKALAQKHGYTSVWYQDLLGKKPLYRYALTYHFIYYFDAIGPDGNPGKVYLPELIGEQSIRMMYTLGVDYWSYGEWNRIFAYQLTYGPWQSERLKSFGAKIFEVGYPRYDDFFNQGIDRQDWLQKLGADPEKPTIVWLPTCYQHTLRQFCEAFAHLSDRYNLLIKPHPLTWKNEAGLIRKLEYLPVTLVRNVDILYLYALADFVCCDYGGTPFGALYTDRPLLLFNHHPETHFDPRRLYLLEALPTTASTESSTLAELNPTELYLRESIVNLYPGQQERLATIFEDKALWEQQQAARASLRQQFFAPYYGNSSRRVAEILQALLEQSDDT